MIPAPEPTNVPEPGDGPAVTPTAPAPPTAAPTEQAAGALVLAPTATPGSLAILIPDGGGEGATLIGSTSADSIVTASATPVFGAAALAISYAATNYALSRRKERAEHNARVRRAAAKAARNRPSLQDRMQKLYERFRPPPKAMILPLEQGATPEQIDLNALHRLGKIYASPYLAPEVAQFAGKGTPVPPPEPSETPVPGGTPDAPSPSRAPTAPLPPDYIPNDPDLFGLDGRWIGRGIRLTRSVGRAFAASAIQYTLVEPGRYIISAPGAAPGTRSTLLSRHYLRGGPYRQSTLSQIGLRQFTPRNLAAGARGTVGVGLATSVVANLWEYGVGGRRETGILSQEFAVSTGVDLVMTVGTGLAAAAAVTGSLALAGAALPAAAVVAITAGVGLVIGIALDQVGFGTALKARVNNGLEAWPGIIQNGATIARAASQRVIQVGLEVSQAATETVTSAVGAAEALAASVGTTIGSAASTVTNGIQTVSANMADSVANAVDTASEFISNLFGGGD